MQAGRFDDDGAALAPQPLGRQQDIAGVLLPDLRHGNVRSPAATQPLNIAWTSRDGAAQVGDARPRKSAIPCLGNRVMKRASHRVELLIS